MRQTFEEACSACESPIEDALLYELAVMNGNVFSLVSAKSLDDLKNEVMASPRGTWCVAPQVRVGRYRCDFCVAAFHGTHFEIYALECDGHAYHNLNEQQRSRDRKRDAQLKTAGVNVVRFTGRRLHREVELVSAEVLDLIGHDSGVEEVVESSSDGWDVVRLAPRSGRKATMELAP